MLTIIFQELTDTQFIDNYTKKMLVNKNDVEIDEVIQYCYLTCFEYLSKHEEKTIKEYNNYGINRIRAICSGIIHRNLRSKTSPFYYTYILKNSNSIIKKRTADKYESFNEIEGWRDNTKKEETFKDDFNTLKYEYETNINDSEYINIFNDLNEREKSILICYIKNNNTYSTTAKELSISVPVLKRELNRLRSKYIKIYDKLYM
jgi:RNA polymerase sigma factor (sigma-70 family)